jgi:fatty acid desaturase
VGHHAYTNIIGADPDLVTSLDGDPRRLVAQQILRKIHKFQWIYMPLLYGLYFFKTRIQDFTEIFGRLKSGPIRVNPIDIQDYVRLAASKSFFLFYRVVVPVVFWKAYSFKEMAICFVVTEMVTGWYLAFIFEVSHISDEADFLVCDPSKRAIGECPAVIDMEWAKSQFFTTVDYGYDKPIMQFFWGSLNYQIVHHLFPGVSQYKLQKITPVVRKIAEEKGLPFWVFDTWTEAMISHIRHYYKMGNTVPNLVKED